MSMAASDWRLGPADAPLLGATLEGILAAIAEIDAPARALDRAPAPAVRPGQLHLTVGHVDLLALPFVGDHG